MNLLHFGVLEDIVASFLRILELFFLKRDEIFKKKSKKIHLKLYLSLHSRLHKCIHSSFPVGDMKKNRRLNTFSNEFATFWCTVVSFFTDSKAFF